MPAEGAQEPLGREGVQVSFSYPLCIWIRTVWHTHKSMKCTPSKLQIKFILWHKNNWKFLFTHFLNWQSTPRVGPNRTVRYVAVSHSSIPAISGSFYRLGLSPPEKSLLTVLQNQSLKRCIRPACWEGRQLVVAGSSSSVCCVEDQWGHSNLEAMVLWLCRIPPDGDLLYL